MDTVLTKKALGSADGQLQNEAKTEDSEEDSEDSIPSPTAQSEKNTRRDSPSSENNNKPRSEAVKLKVTHRDHDGFPRLSFFDGLEYPDLEKCSVDEVYEFLMNFNDAVLNDSAEALRKEKIDGKGLVLLSLQDIRSRLSLKLGPALKLHRLIVNIRTNGHAHWYKDPE